MARLLDRLQEAIAPGLPRGLYTWAQRVCEQIETAITSVNTASVDLTAVEADVDDLAIITSYAIPGTILTGSDAGANAGIVIASHSRRYGNGTTVSVTGAILTALSFSTKYYIYYDQTSMAGGAVTYVATTNPNTAAPSKATGRHFCGVVTTPANGAADTSGGMAPPWGGGLIAFGDVGSTP